MKAAVGCEKLALFAAFAHAAGDEPNAKFCRDGFEFLNPRPVEGFGRCFEGAASSLIRFAIAKKVQLGEDEQFGGRVFAEDRAGLCFEVCKRLADEQGVGLHGRDSQCACCVHGGPCMGGQGMFEVGFPRARSSMVWGTKNKF